VAEMSRGLRDIGGQDGADEIGPRPGLENFPGMGDEGGTEGGVEA
jgi:hypothetical protein